ncbi:MAG TPA: hypothetical protein VFI91_03840 [Longimicrobiaceae bacterium]|nr:hypothetical protein [Longimicrobiaceae bacterium]
MPEMDALLDGLVDELIADVRDAISENRSGADWRAALRYRCLAAALPNMMAMVAAEIHANNGDMLGWCDSRVEFEFTLDLLLEGLERKRVLS